jgi:hypothetical protein
MTLDFEIPAFGDWLGLAVLSFGVMVLIGAMLAAFLSYVFCAVRHGPIEAFYIVGQTGAAAIPDFLATSPRRVMAIARLAAKEAMRRRVWVSLVVFFVVLLYAQWFLDQGSEHPGKLHIAFVMTATSYLVLGLSLFLSTFSLPDDIKNRTIYTVVTKPVRANEIIMGRILGFAGIGTALILVMCVTSLAFVVRGLHHTHQLSAELSFILEDIDANGFWEGQTTFDHHHRHAIRLERKTIDDVTVIEGQTELAMGHVHSVQIIGEGEDARVKISAPQEQLLARVPMFGKLKFFARDGKESATGINIGEEWAYRGYIEGGSLGRFEFDFENVTAANFPDGLPFELNISVFRTHKGTITKGILGTISLVNVDAHSEYARSSPIHFNAVEYVVDKKFIPRKIGARNRKTGEVNEIDLFEELVSDGKLRVVIECSERGQYFGAAQRDVYLRAADQPFWLNFIKGFIGIWLQMVIVTTLGVSFSTLLSGPVAMMVSGGVIMLGLCRDFIDQVFGGVLEQNNILGFLKRIVMREHQLDGVAHGGGPLESIIRIPSQQNVMVDLDALPLLTNIIRVVDVGLMAVMYTVANGLPNLGRLNNSVFVAQGFNVDNSLLAQQCLTTATCCAVLIVISYFCLKTREIAA